MSNVITMVHNQSELPKAAKDFSLHLVLCSKKREHSSSVEQEAVSSKCSCRFWTQRCWIWILSLFQYSFTKEFEKRFLLSLTFRLWIKLLTTEHLTCFFNPSFQMKANSPALVIFWEKVSLFLWNLHIQELWRGIDRYIQKVATSG